MKAMYKSKIQSLRFAKSISNFKIDHYSIWRAYVIDISVWLAMSWVMSVTEFIEKFKQIGEKINLIINPRKILYSLFLFGMFVGSFVREI